MPITTKLVPAFALATVTLAGTAGSASGGLVTGAADFDASFGGVRLKSLKLNGDNNREILVGEKPGTVGMFNDKDFNWTGSDAFALTYDATLDQLTADVQGTIVSYGNFLSSQSITAGEVDTLQIFMRAKPTSNATATVSLSNLVLDGVPLADQTVTDAGLSLHLITGDLADGWTLTGDLGIAGSLKGNENSKVEFTVGRAIPEPASAAALLALVPMALRRRRRSA
jgi:hypothetical protein